jgi:NADH:ubiquinone oxidoreductase subunit 2 (subunit N)
LLAYSSVGHIGLLLIPLCRNNLNRETVSIPGDSIGVLWAYMLIYAIINVGAWSLLLWPMYRPMSIFTRAASREGDGSKVEN